MLREASGNLYGTTYSGGAYRSGVIFKLDPHGREAVLHSFRKREGWLAGGALSQDRAGNLYGTAYFGGRYKCDLGCGTAFKLDTIGNLTVLHYFHQKDGANPQEGFVQDAKGNLIGTTNWGGTGPCAAQGRGCGLIFRVNPATRNFTVLYRFTGGVDGGNPNDLIEDKAGNLYGTTYSAGVFGYGTIFTLDTENHLTVLYSFTGGRDGAVPAAGVLRDGSGNLFGTTYRGGDLLCNAPYGCGTVFKLTPNRELVVIHAFTGLGDGALPENDLFQDRTGALFSMTLAGGVNDNGVLFKLSQRGKERILHNYASGWSFSGLIPDEQGYLYGTTYNTGDHGNGTVFRVKPRY